MQNIPLHILFSILSEIPGTDIKLSIGTVLTRFLDFLPTTACLLDIFLFLPLIHRKGQKNVSSLV